MEEQVINLDDIFQGLKKRWYVIVIIALITTSIATILSFFVIKPKYEASIKVFIGKEDEENKGYNQNDVLMYQNLMKTYSEAIKTKDLVEKSLNNSNLDLEVNKVLSNLQVITIADTQILEIKYTSLSPKEAENVVESIYKEFIKKSKEMVSNGNIQIIENVSLPEKSISPNKKTNIAIGFILGVIIGCGIIFLLEVFDDTFKTKEQLENEFNIPVIGTIPIIKEA